MMEECNVMFACTMLCIITLKVLMPVNDLLLRKPFKKFHLKLEGLVFYYCFDKLAHIICKSNVISKYTS